MIFLILFFFFGFIQYLSSIQFYTCNQLDLFCALSLDFDNGDESNENSIDIMTYDSDYVCQNEYYFDSKTGVEKLILRGIKFCEEINVTNHRTYCYNTDNCNKWIPPMLIQTFIYSNNPYYLPLIILIFFSVFFQYLLLEDRF